MTQFYSHTKQWPHKENFILYGAIYIDIILVAI